VPVEAQGLQRPALIGWRSFACWSRPGAAGAPVGAIQTALGIPASPLSHHLARMAQVGLIRQKRIGRTIMCLPSHAHLNDLIDFLQEECCLGVAPADDAACAGECGTSGNP